MENLPSVFQRLADVRPADKSCRSKRGDILRFRHEHPVVPAKMTGFLLNAAFLMRLGRRAERGFKSPV
jgi:hypothetical protein